MAPAQPGQPLAQRDLAILAFERQWWKYAGAKEEAIRREFGISPTAYYQQLSALIDHPAAMDADPMLVRRLQRQRSARRQQRAGRGAGARTGHPSTGG
jgi:Protein of unknown function (DUF3263)